METCWHLDVENVKLPTYETMRHYWFISDGILPFWTLCIQIQICEFGFNWSSKLQMKEQNNTLVAQICVPSTDDKRLHAWSLFILSFSWSLLLCIWKHTKLCNNLRVSFCIIILLQLRWPIKLLVNLCVGYTKCYKYWSLKNYQWCPVPLKNRHLRQIFGSGKDKITTHNKPHCP